MMLDLESQLSRYGDVLDESPVRSGLPSDLSTATSRVSRRRMLVAAAVVLVVAVVAAAALLRRSDEGSVHIPPVTDIEHTTANLANGVSWSLPDSWQVSDLVPSEQGVGDADLFAVELLAAGTSPRPAGLSGVLCGATPPDPTAAFVSVREYPDGPQPGSGSRPAHFNADGVTPTALPYCDTPQGVQVLRTTFSEQERGFLVYVVIGSQASTQTHTDVWKMLDSLHVEPFTPAPGDTAAQITTAFETAATSTDPSSARDAIDGGAQLPQGVREQIAALGDPGYKIEVRDIVVDGDRARLRYRLGTSASDLSTDSSVLLSGYGYAIERDGTWRVALETACQWVQSLGLACPAVAPTT